MINELMMAYTPELFTEDGGLWRRPGWQPERHWVSRDGATPGRRTRASVSERTNQETRLKTNNDNKPPGTNEQL